MYLIETLRLSIWSQNSTFFFTYNDVLDLYTYA